MKNLHIALLGYGRMGHEIESEAKKRGHTICYTVDTHAQDATYTNIESIPADKVKETSIIIDFSLGAAVLPNAQWYSKHTIPAIIGATGWEESKKDITQLAINNDSHILYGANFSIGAHVFSKISSYTAQLINKIPHYDIGMYENHHNQKKDRPSGTALMVAQEVLKNIDRKTHIISDIPSDTAIDKEALAVVSQRIGYERGFHELIIDSDFDTIKLSHTARARTGFALGAVMAAEWLYTKKEQLDPALTSVDTWIDDLLQ